MIFAGWRCLNMISMPFSEYVTGNLFGLQLLAFSIIGFIIFGTLSVRILKAEIADDSDYLYRGFFTGFITGVTVSFCFYGNKPEPGSLLLTLLIASFSLLLGGTGAYIQYRRDQRKATSFQDLQNSPARFSRDTSPLAVLVILVGLVVIVPPVIAYTGIWTGIFEKSQLTLYRYCNDYEGITVNRISYDSFEIIQPNKCMWNITAMNNEHPYRYWFPHANDPKPPYNVTIEIFTDGKEVTNKSIMQYQGLQDTIDPEQGLNDPQFFRTVLKGPDFIAETTDHRHIEIYSLYYGKRSLLVDCVK
jgi:hypothetical protein